MAALADLLLLRGGFGRSSARGAFSLTLTTRQVCITNQMLGVLYEYRADSLGYKPPASRFGGNNLLQHNNDVACSAVGKGLATD